jgi:hypothetical protein
VYRPGLSLLNPGVLARESTVLGPIVRVKNRVAPIQSAGSNSKQTSEFGTANATDYLPIFEAAGRIPLDSRPCRPTAPELPSIAGVCPVFRVRCRV